MLEKIQKQTTWFEPCCLFRENLELNNVMSYLRKLRNRLLGLNPVVFSEKIEN